MGLTNAAVTPAQVAAQRIRDIDAAMLANMQAALNESFNTFWANAQGATPEEIAAVLGTDCTFGFAMHAYFVQGVCQVAAHDNLSPEVPTSLPPGWTYSLNPDNTLKLVRPPAVKYVVGINPPVPTPPPPPMTPIPIVTGVTCTVTVQALDVAGAPVAGYTGTAAITCTDAAATLPNPATIVFVAGVATFPVTFGMAAAATLTLTDTENNTLTGNAQVTVTVLTA